jgi:hypothetical protein
MAAMSRLPLVLLVLLGGCRVQHDVHRTPDARAAEPPRLQVKQSFDKATGRLAHEYSQLVFVDRRPVKDGREVKYFANGETMWEGTWKEGRKVGAWRFFYEDGTPKSETIYGDARTPTTMTFWHPNGRVSLQGPAINGSRQGTWRIWRKSGLLAEEGPFVGSVREGRWRIYSADGTSVTEVQYSKNVRVSAGTPEACAPVWAEGAPGSGAVAPPPPATDSMPDTAESRGDAAPR